MVMCSIVNGKVTVRVYIIKIWLFLLYLLKCWSDCNKLRSIVQHHKPEFPVKNQVTAFKVKITVKGQNVSECLSG